MLFACDDWANALYNKDNWRFGQSTLLKKSGPTSSDLRPTVIDFWLMIGALGRPFHKTSLGMSGKYGPIIW